MMIRQELAAFFLGLERNCLVETSGTTCSSLRKGTCDRASFKKMSDVFLIPLDPENAVEARRRSDLLECLKILVAYFLSYTGRRVKARENAVVRKAEIRRGKQQKTSCQAREKEE